MLHPLKMCLRLTTVPQSVSKMDAGNGSWYRATGDLDENKPFTWTSGYRIVDLCEFAKQMRCKKCSSLLDLNNTQNETRFGLASVLSVLCYDCRTLNDVCTGKAQRTREGEAMFEINMKTSVSECRFMHCQRKRRRWQLKPWRWLGWVWWERRVSGLV